MATIHSGSHQEITIPGQQHSSLARRDASQLRIGGLVAMERIEPCHAQIGRQSSDVYVQQESQLSQGRRAYA